MAANCHRQALLALCRICGTSIKPEKTVYKVSQYPKDVKLAFEVDVATDEEDIHPPNFCMCCKLKLQRWRVKKNISKKAVPIKVDVIQWTEHNNDSCSVCPNTCTPSSTITPVDAAKEAASKLGIMSWTESDCTIFVRHSQGGTTVQRHLLIRPDGSWMARVHNIDVSQHGNLSVIPKSLHTASDACQLITDFFGIGVCVGNIGFDDVAAGKANFIGQHGEVVGKISDASNPCLASSCVTIHHAKCAVFVDNGSTAPVCKVCVSYRSTLYAMRANKRPSTSTSACTLPTSKVRNDYLTGGQLKEKLANTQKSRRQVTAQNIALKQKIEELYCKESVTLTIEQDALVQQAFSEAQEDIEASIGENDAFRLLLEQQKKAFEAKDGRQIRWHPAIIRFCIALYSKSSSAYNLIRKSNFLKLPHQNTLMKYMQFTSPQVGINPDVLKFIQKDWNIDEMPDFKKNVTLAFDEVKLKAGLVYAKSSGKVIGYTDLGPISNEIENFNKRLQNKTEPDVATQMLVLMARGIFTPMRVAIAYYPTRNASSHQLYHCIWPAVKALTLLDLTVRAFVADGASWNRKFFSHHVLHKEPGRVTYYTPHPFLRNQRLYFICDVPHLVKTTRNNLENSGWNLKSRNLHLKHQDLKWTQLLDLWKWDRGEDCSSPGLRMMPRVSQDHLYLTPSLRMRVSLAAQVLSTTVANCLKLQGRHDTKSLEEFIRMMDKFFDCLNVKKFRQGDRINKDTLTPYTDVNDDRFRWLLQEFLPWLEEWEREAMATPGLTRAECRKLCLSEQTFEGIRISVLAFVELGQDLLRHSGAKYLLSDKFNQDPLEEWFSLARGAGGSNNNPTAKELGHIHLNLLVAGSNAVASTKGNCRNQKRKADLSDIPLPMKKVKRSTHKL